MEMFLGQMILVKQKFKPNGNKNQNGLFGYSVGISGNFIVVGMPEKIKNWLSYNENIGKSFTFNYLVELKETDITNQYEINYTTTKFNYKITDIKVNNFTDENGLGSSNPDEYITLSNPIIVDTTCTNIISFWT